VISLGLDSDLDRWLEAQTNG